MEYGNLSVIGMVLVLVTVVLGIAYTGLYFLNRDVDHNGQNAP
jgi:hypothetical protein